MGNCLTKSKKPRLQNNSKATENIITHNILKDKKLINSISDFIVYKIKTSQMYSLI